MTTPSTHLNVLAPGYKLHWYTITRVLGRGGFGITYLAQDTNLNTEVAIKEFLPSSLALRGEDELVKPLSDNLKETYEWGLARFLEEARTLAQFRHPNIVLVHSVFEANETAYIVMEYQRGENLETAYRNKRITTEAQLKPILYKLMDGIEIVHNAQFVHRDIKPANIFLKEDDEPVLLDFGSARQALGVETQTLTAMVSPGYAPFEQYNSSSDQDNQGPWTDIYALACTIYRGIAGKSHADALILAKDRIEGRSEIDQPATEAGRGRFSEEFLHGIDVAMRFSADQRPQSISEWRVVFEGEANLPPSPDDTATILQPVPPAPAATEAAITPAVTAAATTAATATTAAETSAAAPASAGTDGPGRKMPLPLLAGAAVVVLGALYFLSGRGTDTPDVAPVAQTAPAQSAPAPAPTPAPTPAPAPATPAPDAAPKPDMSAIEAITAQASCGKAKAALSADAVTVSGHLTAKETSAMVSQLNAVPGVSSVSVQQLSVYPDTFCDVVKTMTPLWEATAAAPGNLTVSTPSSDNSFREGERLVLTMKSDLFDTSYLYVDYFTLDGSVVHLLTEASEQSFQITRNENLVLGEEGDIERWDISGPFGEEFISVVSSTVPLFNDRTQTDPQETASYLQSLQQRIDQAISNGAKVAATGTIIRTSK